MSILKMAFWSPLVCIALAAPPTTSRAQASTLLARFPAQVRAAEAEGARYARGVAASAAPRRCVDASGTARAQSGDFLAGSFRYYPGIWYQGSGKLWFRPTKVVAGETLVVRARSLAHPRVAREFRLTTIAESSVGLGPRRFFYPSPIRAPSAGPWLFVASVGQNWGCFLLLI